MSVYIEDSEDEEQRRLIQEMREVERELGIVTPGVLGWLRKLGLQRTHKRLDKAYDEQALKLGRESNGYYRRG